MDRFSRRARRVSVAVALTVAAGLSGGCSRPDVPDAYAMECERRVAHAAIAPTSLADAVAQQAAVNKAYRQCIDRTGVRASH